MSIGVEQPPIISQSGREKRKGGNGSAQHFQNATMQGPLYEALPLHLLPDDASQARLTSLVHKLERMAGF
jgi:hypothetical protein